MGKRDTILENKILKEKKKVLQRKMACSSSSGSSSDECVLVFNRQVSKRPSLSDNLAADETLIQNDPAVWLAFNSTHTSADQRNGDESRAQDTKSSVLWCSKRNRRKDEEPAAANQSEDFATDNPPLPGLAQETGVSTSFLGSKKQFPKATASNPVPEQDAQVANLDLENDLEDPEPNETPKLKESQIQAKLLVDSCPQNTISFEQVLGQVCADDQGLGTISLESVSVKDLTSNSRQTIGSIYRPECVTRLSNRSKVLTEARATRICRLENLLDSICGEIEDQTQDVVEDRVSCQPSRQLLDSNRSKRCENSSVAFNPIWLFVAGLCLLLWLGFNCFLNPSCPENQLQADGNQDVGVWWVLTRLRLIRLVTGASLTTVSLSVAVLLASVVSYLSNLNKLKQQLKESQKQALRALSSTVMVSATSIGSVLVVKTLKAAKNVDRDPDLVDLIQGARRAICNNVLRNSFT